MTYLFLQHYWWFLVSLLGALLVFLLFVQGANSMIFHLGDTPEERRLLVNCTGRKWELTFTTWLLLAVLSSPLSPCFTALVLAVLIGYGW